MSNLVLRAPLEGWSGPLDEVPDEVFATRMLGDGLAIDPTGSTLHAPCDGELIVVPASKHAVTIRAANGAEILIHVGIDTVNLRGEGFELHVAQGDRVKSGDRLISFDLDWIARSAKSAITPVIVANGDRFRIEARRQDRAVSVGDELLELIEIGSEHSTIGSAESAQSATKSFVVGLEHGIHARPAAMFAACAKRFSSTVTVRAHGRKANGKSAVSLMALRIRFGDEALVEAVGLDAAQAVAALEALVVAASKSASAPSVAMARPQPRTGAVAPTTDAANSSAGAGTSAVGTAIPAATAANSAVSAANPTARAAIPAAGVGISAAGAAIPAANSAASAANPAAHIASPAARAGIPGAITGVCASAGLAIGHVVQLSRPEIRVAESGQGATYETAEFDRAHAAVKADLHRRIETSQGAQRSVAEAHLEFLEDPELLDATRELIAQGKSAGHAWRQAIQRYIALVGEADDARIQERVDDLLDLETQVLLAVSGQISQSMLALPDNAIVLAKELLPSQFSQLDPTKLAGICTASGGPTSHVAILAAAMGVPAVVAAGAAVLEVPNGTRVLLDADNGLLTVDPNAFELETAEKLLAARNARRSAERETAQRECRTADGHRIEVFANVGSVADARIAVAEGAEGCGLLRTEFLFLDRQTPPDEAEQTAQYQAIAAAFAPRPVIIRTLDIGGDKPIAYLPLPHEENPALGLRGVRTSLWRLDLLREQLRAVLNVRPVEQCKLLLPMITSGAEIRAVRATLKEVAPASAIQVGVMIETPASAVIADKLLADADFLSIGTNDLTQYTLAMDRGHPELAAQLDALHPAVLRLIAIAAKAGRAQNKLVAVCGGLASDPVAAPILIGLGVNELSTIASVIPRLKSLISSLSMDECRELAHRALELPSAAAVREMLKEHAVEKIGAPA
jgi:phosphoenolpyruvate-protein phosphotransferase